MGCSDTDQPSLEDAGALNEDGAGENDEDGAGEIEEGGAGESSMVEESALTQLSGMCSFELKIVSLEAYSMS